MTYDTQCINLCHVKSYVENSHKKWQIIWFTGAPQPRPCCFYWRHGFRGPLVNSTYIEEKCLQSNLSFLVFFHTRLKRYIPWKIEKQIISALDAKTYRNFNTNLQHNIFFFLFFSFTYIKNRLPLQARCYIELKYVKPCLEYWPKQYSWEEEWHK